MLIIRLQRTGKKRQPEFRIVLAEKYRHASKKFLEIIGNYNPRNKNFTIKDQERLSYWLSKHVGVSPTVHSLLVDHGMTKDAEKVQARRVVKKDEPAPAEAPAEEAVSEEAAPAAEEQNTEATTDAPVEESPAAEVAESSSTDAPEHKSEDKPAEESAPAEAPAEEQTDKPTEEEAKA